MVGLTTLGLTSLRPQVAADMLSPSKSPKKAQESESRPPTLDVASVSDVARPHRNGGRSSKRTERAPVSAEEQEVCLVRSPSGSKLVNPATRFPFGACFTFWLRRGSAEDRKNQDLVELGSVTEVLDFWKYWNGIVLERLPAGSLLAVFRHPDRPRAGAKAAGGRWVISPGAQEVGSIFEELTLALVGGEFDETSEGAPCGVAFSKGQKTQVEVWNRTSEDDANRLVQAKIRELVGEEVAIEYCAHRLPGGPSVTP